MTTTISTDAALLRDALARSVCDTNTPEPIYRHVLIGEWTNGITLTTTDSLMTYRTQIEADIQGESPDFTASVPMLRAALFGLNGPVTIEHKGATLKLCNESRRYRIDTLPGRIFPVFDDLPVIETDADAMAWARAIDAVQYAAPTNSGHVALNGICLEPEFIIASDAIAIALQAMNTGLKTDIVIPIAAVRKNLLRYITENTAITILANDTGTEPVAIEFSDKTQYLRIQLLAYKYPAFRAQLPKPESMASSTEIRAKDFSDLLHRMMPFILPPDNKKGKPLIILRAEGEQLQVRSKVQGFASDFIACTRPSKPMEAALDAALMKNLLGQCDETLTWYSNGAESIQAFTLPERDDVHYIMHVRL